MNSKKASIILIDCRTFGSVGPDDLNSLSEQLFRCETSLNPFDRLRSAGLRERIQFIRQQELQKELEEERQKVREETKFFKCVSSQGFLDDYKITRNTFDAWEKNFLSLRELMVSDDGTSRWKRVSQFEDINPDGVFQLNSLGYNYFDFNGNIEEIVHARNCVRNILSGKALIPPFNEEGTVVIYEPKFATPEGFVIPPNLGFQLPIKPDAMLIHGTSWLLIKSKHSCSKAEIELVQKQVEFIKANADQPWVYKDHQIPTLIIGVVNSMGPFREDNVRAQDDGTMKLLQGGLPKGKYNPQQHV